MSFAIKVDARLRALESLAKEVAELRAEIIANGERRSKEIADLYAELERLTAKRGPGRPPKNG